MATRTVAPAAKAPRALRKKQRPTSTQVESDSNLQQDVTKLESDSTAVLPLQKPDVSPWAAWKADSDASMNVLCSFIVEGGSLNAFCKERGFPYNTLRDWIETDSGRSAKYARAREDRSDTLADEIVGISDESEVKVVMQGETERLELDSAAVARNRLRVDARKWVAAKLKPRVYGEKLEMSGSLDLKTVNDEDLLKRAAALVALLNATGSVSAPETRVLTDPNTTGSV